MQPHSVAILNIANYIKQQGLESKFISGSFDVKVEDGGGKYYNIDVTKSGSGYSARVNGRWTCTADLSISGDQASVSHHTHSLVPTRIVEKAHLSSGSLSGRIEDSNTKEFNGSLSGSSRDNGKSLSFHSTPKGNKPDSTITNVKSLQLKN